MMAGHCVLPPVLRPLSSLPSSSTSQSPVLIAGTISRVQNCTELESRRDETLPFCLD